MAKLFLILLIGTMSLGVPQAQAAKPLDLPVCKIARAKTAYAGIVVIPADVKTDIAAYKKSWVDLCARKPTASLPQTLGMAKAIEEKFEPILSSAATRARSADGEGNWKNIDATHDFFQKTLPKFIPAFEGSTIEWFYFQPNFGDFKQMAKYGDAEDKRSFQLQTDFPRETTLPAWYQGTWDHGGCLRFGEYDWVQAFQRFREGKKFKALPYKKIFSEHENLLTETLGYLHTEYSDGEFNDICTCKKKDAVRTDLAKLAAYLKKENTHGKLLARLQKTLRAIEVGQIPINSEAEISCSTGG